MIQFLSLKRCQDLLRQYKRAGNYVKLDQVVAVKLLQYVKPSVKDL